MREPTLMVSFVNKKGRRAKPKTTLKVSWISTSCSIAPESIENTKQGNALRIWNQSAEGMWVNCGLAAKSAQALPTLYLPHSPAATKEIALEKAPSLALFPCLTNPQDLGSGPYHRPDRGKNISRNSPYWNSLRHRYSTI